jgi:hypothetical protein
MNKIDLQENYHLIEDNHLKPGTSCALQYSVFFSKFNVAHEGSLSKRSVYIKTIKIFNAITLNLTI